MSPTRSPWIVLLLAIGLALCMIGTSHAQGYPARLIRIIVPLAPGGGNDTMARLIAGKLEEAMGQKVLVENRPGGGSVIASEIVLEAPADGYVLYLISSSVASAPSLHKTLPFDTVRDFMPITRLGVVPGALTVHASLPVRSVTDFIGLARTRPDEIRFGSAGIGSGSHLGGELFKQLANVKLLHVPYKGSALATRSLLSGEVMASFGNPISALPYVKSGRLRILGLTSAQRWPLLPQFPTIAEAGVPGYEYLIWNGMAVRAGTPQAIVDRLQREITAAAHRPDVVDYLAKSGSRAMTQTPADFGRFFRSEVDKIRKVLHASASPSG